uniref:Catsper channel auxiliary subunit epsilon n=1 Tax=Rousettus aegyptiacus TaxID=9407 RepID=A0A7J8B9D7_ROUAE|nr:catsper channel auxiliary subunit epsilon [Rousettus aegyptiacus]
MSAQGVAVLLSWMSCCGSALWRYYTNSPNYHIFSTRTTIKLEYEGTSFSEWSVPATCSVKNKKSPKTELRCSSPGIHIIKPVVTGPDPEEERYLSVDSSHTCFLWYCKVGFFHNLNQVLLTIWIYDPENADPNELLQNANEPSLNSIVLSKQLASLGQSPTIHTFLKRKSYFPHGKVNGTWRISLPLVADDALKEIKGNKVAFQDCFIEDYLFLLTFPFLTIPEIPGFLPVTSPRGSQLIADWNSCFPSGVVLVADMETFQTNDSFRTWTRIRVPPNILTDDERHNVSDVNLYWSGIFFLINGIVYFRNLTAFTRLGNNENLPEGGIIGLSSRKWCWSKYKLKTVTFYQTVDYEAVKDYFTLQNKNTGLLVVRVRPSEYTKMCPAAQKVFQVAVGCDFSKFIAVKGFDRKSCRWHDFFYIIKKSYLRDRPSKNLRVKYDWKKYGCPLRLNFKEKFHPVLQLYSDDGYIEDVDVNFIVWEIHGRDDYSFNNTMKTSGCLNEAQTWNSMHKLNKHLPLEYAWGPENYNHCFSYAIGKPGDLNQPYEIINKSNHNHLVWPMQHTGMYVFRAKILDPNYSFCNLTAIFAIEIYGTISSPNGDLVIAFLFLLMLLFFSILVLSYFHYMRIYRQYIYAPIYKTRRIKDQEK